MFSYLWKVNWVQFADLCQEKFIFELKSMEMNPYKWVQLLEKLWGKVVQRGVFEDLFTRLIFVMNVTFAWSILITNVIACYVCWS